MSQHEKYIMYIMWIPLGRLMEGFFPSVPNIPNMVWMRHSLHNTQEKREACLWLLWNDLRSRHRSHQQQQLHLLPSLIDSVCKLARYISAAGGWAGIIHHAADKLNWHPSFNTLGPGQRHPGHVQHSPASCPGAGHLAAINLIAYPCILTQQSEAGLRPGVNW